MFKSRKSTSLLVFVILLLISFVGLTVTANLLGSTQKFDLTDNKRFSLSPASKKILSELTAPVYVRVYLSNNLVKENPQYSAYASFVLRYLKKYQQAAAVDNVKIEVLNPEPYSPLEEEAKKAGIKAIPDAGGQSNLYFGAVFTNATGAGYVIPNFIPARSGLLETDISKIFAKINDDKRPTVGLISPQLPLISRQYGKIVPNWAIVAQLQNDYNILPLSEETPVIPGNVDVLVVINLKELSPLLTYALDQYILRGGRLLVFNDVFSEKQVELYNAQNFAAADMNRLFRNWGFRQDNQNVVGDRGLGEIMLMKVGSSSQAKNFPFWMQLTAEQINQDHPLTSGLKNIRLKTPGSLRPEENPDGVRLTPLLTTAASGGTLSVREFTGHTQPELAAMFKGNEGKYTLALLAEGKFDSLFTANIMAGTEFERKMPSFLPHSIAPARIVAVADSDLIVAENWADTSETIDNPVYGLAPVYDNGNFILRAVDYLAGRDNVLGLTDKETGSSKTVGEIIYSDVFNRHAREYNLLQQELEINTRAMSVVEQELSRNKLALSAETMSAIEQHRKEIGRLQQELKQIEYQIKQENEKRLSSIITANVIIIPAAVIILLAGCFLFIRCRKLNAVKEIFNVSSSD